MGITYGKKDKVFRQYGKPSLLLDFARRKKLLDTVSKKNPITFTRASSVATYVDADGLIKKAAVNLALYSEQFDNAAWGKDAGISLSANQTISPDGKQTADKVITLSNSSIKRLYFNYSSSINTTYTFSIYLKMAETRYVKVSSGGAGISNTGAGGSGNDRDFKVDLLTCTITNNIFQYSPTITNIGNGWCRVTITITTDSDGGSIIPYIWPLDSSQNTSYTGDGVSGFYVWGAQLEEGSVATPYIKTTSTTSGAPRFDHDPVTGESKGLLIEEARTNLLLYSESGTLTTNSWTNVSSGMTITYQSGGPAPDGSNNSLTIQESGSTGQHYVALDTYSVTSGSNYTVSFWAKNISGSDTDSIKFTTGANFPYAVRTFYIRGSQAGTASGEGTDVKSYGNGWYRFSYTATANATNTNAAGYIDFRGLGSGNAYNNVVSIFGVQVEAGSFPTSYIPTNGSTVQRTADIATVEGNDFKRTNLIGYSQEFNNWSKTNITVQDNSTIAPDGTLTAATIRANIGTGEKRIQKNGAIDSISKIRSIYVKQGTARYAAFNVISTIFSSFFTVVDLQEGTIAYQSNDPRAGTSYSVEGVGNGWLRVSFIGDNTSDTRNGFNIGIVDSNSLSGTSASWTSLGTETIHIWGAQLEESDYPTDYIPTTTTSASVYNWTNDTQGTMLSVYSKFAPNEQANRNVWSLDTNGTNYIAVFSDYAFHSDLHNDIVISTGGNGYINVTKPAVGTEVKNSLSYTPLTSSVAINGSVYQINNSALPPIGRLTIGARAGSFSPLNGHIKKMTYWNSALSGSALQLMTGDE